MTKKSCKPKGPKEAFYLPVDESHEPHDILPQDGRLPQNSFQVSPPTPDKQCPSYVAYYVRHNRYRFPISRKSKFPKQKFPFWLPGRHNTRAFYPPLDSRPHVKYAKNYSTKPLTGLSTSGTEIELDYILNPDTDYPKDGIHERAVTPPCFLIAIRLKTKISDYLDIVTMAATQIPLPPSAREVPLPAASDSSRPATPNAGGMTQTEHDLMTLSPVKLLPPNAEFEFSSLQNAKPGLQQTPLLCVKQKGNKRFAIQTVATPYKSDNPDSSPRFSDDMDDQLAINRQLAAEAAKMTLSGPLSRIDVGEESDDSVDFILSKNNPNPKISTINEPGYERRVWNPDGNQYGARRTPRYQPVRTSASYTNSTRISGEFLSLSGSNAIPIVTPGPKHGAFSPTDPASWAGVSSGISGDATNHFMINTPVRPYYASNASSGHQSSYVRNPSIITQVQKYEKLIRDPTRSHEMPRMSIDSSASAPHELLGRTIPINRRFGSIDNAIDDSFNSSEFDRDIEVYADRRQSRAVSFEDFSMPSPQGRDNLVARAGNIHGPPSYAGVAAAAALDKGKSPATSRTIAPFDPNLAAQIIAKSTPVQMGNIWAEKDRPPTVSPMMALSAGSERSARSMSVELLDGRRRDSDDAGPSLNPATAVDLDHTAIQALGTNIRKQKSRPQPPPAYNPQPVRPSTGPRAMSRPTAAAINPSRIPLPNDRRLFSAPQPNAGAHLARSVLIERSAVVLFVAAAAVVNDDLSVFASTQSVVGKARMKKLKKLNKDKSQEGHRVVSDKIERRLAKQKVVPVPGANYYTNEEMARRRERKRATLSAQQQVKQLRGNDDPFSDRGEHASSEMSGFQQPDDRDTYDDDDGFTEVISPRLRRNVAGAASHGRDHGGGSGGGGTPGRGRRGKHKDRQSDGCCGGGASMGYRAAARRGFGMGDIVGRGGSSVTRGVGHGRPLRSYESDVSHSSPPRKRRMLSYDGADDEHRVGMMERLESRWVEASGGDQMAR